MKPKRATKPVPAPVPSAYGTLLADLKRRVRSAQVRAALSVNRELVLLYWHIGREILRSQQAEGWGAKIIERLALDLRAEFPDMSGLSPRNLKYMRSFAEAYSGTSVVQQAAGQFVQQLAAQLPKLERAAGLEQTRLPIVQQAAAQLEFDLPPEPFASLPWFHNCLLLDRVKDSAARLWYARQTLAHGWSRPVLEVEGEDYTLDLLFYHLRLRCFFVIDLKMRAFQPEDAGKMNFYLSAVDGQMCHNGDKPTIGLLLCKDHKRLTVEYALRNFTKPIGVARWRTRLVDSLPKKWRGLLPSVEELERQLR